MPRVVLSPDPMLNGSHGVVPTERTELARGGDNQ